MNKYISKALIYDKRVDILSITGFTFFIYFTNIMRYFSSFYYNGYYNYSALLDLGAFLPSALIASLAISIYSDKTVKYFHLQTEPYKRDTIAFTNLMIPILSFGFSLMLYGIIATLIFAFKSNSLNTIGVLWSRVIFIFTLLIFINSLVQFFQMLFGNYIAGALIPLLFAFGIPIPTLFLGNLISNKIPFLKSLFDSIVDIFTNILINISKTIGFITNSSTSTITYSPDYVTNINSIITISFFIVSIILMFLTIKLNNKLKSENIYKIFMFKWLEKVFLVLSSLLTLSFIVFVVTIIFPILDLNNQNVLLIIDICLIPIAIIIYKVVSKVWTITSR